MEATSRWVPLTALAPVAWGATYYVTHRFLPADYPLYGAVLRALPAGLLLLLVRRTLPRGKWWWRSLVLGTLNMGAFFALVYLAAQLLPTSLASTIMATAPVMMMLIAWAALAERPRAAHLAGAGIGIAGVCLLLLDGAVTVDFSGVLASVAAMLMSSLGYVLAKKWSAGVDVFSLTSWQLVAGGVVLIPLAVAVEGRPPALDGPALAGFGYVTVVATALAFAAWFTGLRHLSAGTVGLIGLLNPVTGVLLGTVVAGETLAPQQVCGLVLVFLGILLGQPAMARLGALLRATRTDRTTQADRADRADQADRGDRIVRIVRADRSSSAIDSSISEASARALSRSDAVSPCRRSPELSARNAARSSILNSRRIRALSSTLASPVSRFEPPYSSSCGSSRRMKMIELPDGSTMVNREAPGR